MVFMVYIFRGVTLSFISGSVEGELLVSVKPISPLGDIDSKTGVIQAFDNPLRGSSVKGKILVVPQGRGSTVGSYVLLELARNDVAPKAILLGSPDVMIITGCVIANIPVGFNIDKSIFRLADILNGRRGFLRFENGRVMLEVYC